MPCLTVGDNAYERGLAHGKTFSSDVAANLGTYLRRFEASGLPRHQALEEAMRWQAAMETQNPEYVEEMAGLAKGAAQSTAAIALLNARYEIAFMIFGKDARKQEKGLAQATDETDGCTTFGLLSEVTADGHTWLGQNWDWIAGVHQRTLVLRIQRSMGIVTGCLRSFTPYLRMRPPSAKLTLGMALSGSCKPSAKCLDRMAAKRSFTVPAARLTLAVE
jgi:isopenicillin-N N-acyltransferase-like protein